MAPPRTVLARNLTFVEGDRQMIVPQGTVCEVYNSHLHASPEGEELLKRAKAINARAGEFVQLVMIVKGKPRLLLRADTCREQVAEPAPPSGGTAASPTPKPPTAKPVEAKPKSASKQPTLF